jgi:hypothetical protein
LKPLQEGWAVRTTWILLAGVLLGCGASQQRPGNGLEGESAEAAREARALRGACERGGEEVTYDLNHDGTPDIREVYRRQALVCRETDLNFDGRVDVFRYFDGGTMRREEMDLDRDGNLDVVAVYDASGQSVVREEYDTNYDSRIDVWRYMSGNSVQRVERDSDHNGNVDTWTHCSGGRAVRLQYDTTGDGEPDSNHDVGEQRDESECNLTGAAPAAEQGDDDGASGEDEAAGDEAESDAADEEE